MKSPADNFMAGMERASFDFTIGYVSQFLKLHLAPQEVQDNFINISAAYVKWHDQQLTQGARE